MVWDFKVKGRGREVRAKRRVFSFEENSICKELVRKGAQLRSSTDGVWVGGGAMTGQMWLHGVYDLALNHECGRNHSNSSSWDED